MQALVDLKEFRKTGEYRHIISHMTPGYADLEREQRHAVLEAFFKAPKGDHLYVLHCQGKTIYVAENGQGYTAMLPEEY